MSRVYIVTDSAATIETAVAEHLDITVLPLTVRIDHQDYQDGADLDHEELLLRMAHDRIRPSIVGPTSEQFRRLYSRLTRRTDKIISLHSSASLSLVCREARRAASEFLGRCDIVVIDSETLSLGLGILVQEAARLANASIPLSEITRQMRGIIRRIYIVLVTDTLDYLEHSQRVSPAQAILGTMLGIKPFLALEEGEIIPMEKVRNRERAIDKLAEFASEFSSIEQVAILQSTRYPTQETKMLQERLALIAPGHDFPILLYGPLLASHIGPDGMGLIVYEGTGRGVLPL
ncbi:MAG TPA: DegV family protein [Anaerolineae bacterium]|nr:DegV family protein [Anaerolineae bacterium]